MHCINPDPKRIPLGESVVFSSREDSRGQPVIHSLESLVSSPMSQVLDFCDLGLGTERLGT